MNLKELEQKVNSALNNANEWQELHDVVVKIHEHAESEQEYVKLLELHKKLLDRIEKNLPKHINIEKFQSVRLQEYNLMLLRECTIGGSVCAETLYELTQRELEAGRMSPTHEFIDTAVHATASQHYSRDQLVRQKEKIKKIEENSTLNKFSRIFKN